MRDKFHENDGDINKELIIASENGNEKKVLEFISLGADVNHKGPNSMALHCAAFNGFEAIVEILLQNGADPNIPDNQSFYPLQLAVSKKELSICEMLLAKNANVNVLTEKEGSLLHLAAAIDFVEIFELDKIDEINLEHEDAFGRTTLNTAASLGQLEFTKILVSKKAEINTTDNNNLSPLLNALIHLEESMIKEWQKEAVNGGVKVKYEIINGCFRYIKPYTDDTSLGQILPAWQQEEICEELSWAPKEQLNYWKSIDLINFLTRNGADIKFKSNEGSCAMIHACSIGEPSLIQNLIVAGATFDVKNNLGITPLHYLARSKRIDGLEEYYNQNVDKFSNFKDENGWTPAHFLADTGGNRKMAEILIENHIDLNIKSTKEFAIFPIGTKAYEVAKHWDDLELMNLLS